MTVEMSFVIDLRILALLCALLAAFGAGYNHWVAHLEEQGHHRGYLSFIVALGVGMTGLAFSLATSWQLGLILLGCFIASGGPMIWGSISRYITARAAEEAHLEERALRQLQRQEDR
jgi:hypothetical protein